MSLTIGLDVGTQGAKALLYDHEQRVVVARSAVNYDLLPTNVPGRAEQDPEQWTEASQTLIKTLIASVPKEMEVVAIGVSGQQHGLLALDKNDQVIRPAKLWCDVESSEEAQYLTDKLDTVIVPSVTLPKLLWMKHKEPENFAKVESVLLPHDYINFILSGKKYMEAGDASGLGAFNIYDRVLDPKALKLVDENLHLKFPPLLEPNSVLGTVKPMLATKLGLSASVVVSPGSGDNMMSALGAGAVNDGILVLSLGTSGTLFGCSNKPIFDKDGVVCPFCDATGFWLPLVCTMSCTGVLEEVKKCFDLSHEELTALAEKEPIGCHGVNFLPYLSGERTPNWPLATGVISGISPGSFRPGLIYRAALEGATFTLLNGLKSMEALGLNAKELRVVGGGSKNILWRKVIADAFQMPLKFPLESESAALGAALQAGAVYRKIPIAKYVESQNVPLAKEIVVPDKNNATAYQEVFQRHMSLGVNLFGSKRNVLENEHVPEL